MVSPSPDRRPIDRQISREDRSAARREIRQLRQHLSPLQRQVAAIRLGRHLVSSAVFRRARRVAVYWPTAGEMDLTPVIHRCWQMGKWVFLPVLATPPGKRMEFGRYTRSSRLVVNRYGIPEPAQPPGERLRAAQLDIILMPLVAMDSAGNRVGMGAGYYDRTLENVAGSALSPTLIGVGYQFQQVRKIESQPWDIRLDWLVTDQALSRVRPVQPGC